MEYDITNMVVGVLIGMGIVMGAISLYIWHVMSRFEAGLREHIRTAVREVEASLVPILIEQDGDQLFAYRESDRQFLCQGASIAEIRTKFQAQYPDKTAFLAESTDPALIVRLKDELKLLREQEANETSHRL